MLLMFSCLFVCLFVFLANSTQEPITDLFSFFLAHSRVFIPPPQELNLVKNLQNVTADCYGYGKPAPKVIWIHNNKDIPTVPSLTDETRGNVVQMEFEPRAGSPWNAGSRLYLRADGVTYQDAGNYTCEVFNGVGGNISATDTLQVFCK